MSVLTPFIAGNWKLNHGPTETVAYFQNFLPLVRSDLPGTVAIVPPSISLNSAQRAIGERSDIMLGVQNVYWESAGAFTGEISAVMARDAGAGIALIGHSERRHVFGETDVESARKARATLDAGLLALFCVGELLDERDAGNAKSAVGRQFEELASVLSDADLGSLVIAYEPVWAIGTGRTASPADASEMHAFLRELLDRKFGHAAAEVPVLYGGSVKPENASELLRADFVDGLLVGGASLDPQSFAKICALRS